MKNPAADGPQAGKTQQSVGSFPPANRTELEGGEPERTDRPLCKDVILSLRKNDAPGNGGTQRVFFWNVRNRWMREPFIGDSYAKHALRVLCDFAGESCDCWPSYTTIARAMECSPRQAKRSVAHLGEHKIILIFPPRRGRRSNTYRLRDAEIENRSKAAKAVRDQCHTDTPAVTDSHPNGDCQSPKAFKEASKEATTPQPPKPQKRRAAQRAASCLPDEWQAVVVEMIDYSVLDPEPAVATARQRGCSASFARQIIEYAESKKTADGTRAWNGGGLRRRITNLVIGQSIDDETLWLPVDPAYERARRREAEQKQEAERRRREAWREALIQDDLQKQETLESEFGPVLDSLSGSKRNELITQVFDSFHQQRIRRSLQRDGQIPKHDRLQLLRHRAEGQLSAATNQENPA